MDKTSESPVELTRRDAMKAGVVIAAAAGGSTLLSGCSLVSELSKSGEVQAPSSPLLESTVRALIAENEAAKATEIAESVAATLTASAPDAPSPTALPTETKAVIPTQTLSAYPGPEATATFMPTPSATAAILATATEVQGNVELSADEAFALEAASRFLGVPVDGLFFYDLSFSRHYVFGRIADWPRRIDTGNNGTLETPLKDKLLPGEKVNLGQIFTRNPEGGPEAPDNALNHAELFVMLNTPQAEAEMEELNAGNEDKWHESIGYYVEGDGQIRATYYSITGEKVVRDYEVKDSRIVKVDGKSLGKPADLPYGCIQLAEFHSSGPQAWTVKNAPFAIKFEIKAAGNSMLNLSEGSGSFTIDPNVPKDYAIYGVQMLPEASEYAYNFGNSRFGKALSELTGEVLKGFVQGFKAA